MLVTTPYVSSDINSAITEAQLKIAGNVMSYVRSVDTTTLRSLPAGSKVDVTPRFIEVMDLFATTHQMTPAGFKIDIRHGDGVTLDLVRDIGFDAGNKPRATPVLFSADSANPYEISECRDVIANVTCNPGIVYDLFLNNPKANIGGEFRSLEQVLRAIADNVGPGCDVSVELHDPYEADFSRIMDEIAMYEDILSKYRLVVKVPHTGAVSPSEKSALLTGDGLLGHRFYDAAPRDLFRGHSLALKLTELGHRVNFTLMFEPYQVALALQTRPYFINAFVRHRLISTRRIEGLLAGYTATEDVWFATELRSYLIKNHFLGRNDDQLGLLETLTTAKGIVDYRLDRSDDGLDNARASLHWLRASNLDESKLIICSMDGDAMFPSIMTMMIDPEFIDLQNRVLITTDPRYLARWTSSPHVIGYQQRFLKACATPALDAVKS